MNILKIKINLRTDLSDSAKNIFWDDFIKEAIEENNLQYGGLAEGCAEPDGDFEISIVHEDKVSSWLKNRMEVGKYDVGIYSEKT